MQKMCFICEGNSVVMRNLLLVFFNFILTFNINSQVKFPSFVEKLSPTISTEKLLKKKYYLVHEKDWKSNKNETEVIRKLGENYYIITLKGVNELKKFKGQLFSINNDWKIHNQVTLLKKSKRTRIVVKVVDSQNFTKALDSQGIEVSVLRSYKNILLLEASSNDINKIANIFECTSISVRQTPQVESLPLEKVDLGVNQIFGIHNQFESSTGNGITISVKEELFDVEDIDLRNRVRLFGKEAEEVSSHATLMASIIGGAGNSTYNSVGIAKECLVSSSDFSGLLPDEDTHYKEHSIFIENHSYGTIIENFYGAEARAYDESSVAIPKLLHVFSSGNIGGATSSEGNYTGVEGYANLTGNFKQAKNALVVGSVNEVLQVNSFSSKGPAFDGRIKPELVAHGPEGTSDAAAIVSGVAALLQQKYKEQKLEYPSSELVKSILIAGADDVAQEGIDFRSGYGNVNALQSMQILEDSHYIQDEISSNLIKEYTIPISAATKQLRIALVWNDVPANVNDATTLVNDLDLEIQKDSDVWMPWVLDASPDTTSIEKLAVMGVDHTNNVELVSMTNPEEGTYTIRVKANSLETATQSFSIAYFVQEASVFTWEYPSKSDKLPAATDQIIRWTNTFDASVSKLEYAVDNGSWTEIASGVNTSFFKWNVPSVNGKVQLRAMINGTYYVSEPFIISEVIIPKIDFNCDENIQISWNAISEATEYEIKRLDSNFMNLYKTQNGTSILIPKSDLAIPYIEVTPVFSGESGVKGQTVNYTTQGVNCYYKNFLAFLTDTNTVDLRLNLSTLNKVAFVAFEKEVNGKIETVKEFNTPSSIELSTEDVNVVGGKSTYRVKIVLDDQTELYTDGIDIDFPFDATLSVYPNPVIASEGMFVYSKGNNLELQIVDVTGRILYTEQLRKIRQTVAIPEFRVGMLWVRILKDGNQLACKKILVIP